MLHRFAHILIPIACLIISPILCAQSDSSANQSLDIQINLPENRPTKPAAPSYQTLTSDVTPITTPSPNQARTRIQSITRKLHNTNPQTDTISQVPIVQSVAAPDTLPPTTDAAAQTPLTESPTRALLERNRSGNDPTASSSPGNQTPGASLVTGNYLLQTITALGIVIGLLFLIRYLYAKATGHVTTSSAAAVQVLARTSIAPRNHIIILRVGSRILICSDSSHGTRTLSEITDPEEVAQLLAETSAAKENSITKSFNNMLGRYGADYDKQGRHPEEGLDTVEFQSDSARESVSKLLSRVRDLAGKGGPQ
ncbi:hypothetical protein KS4_12260 [Poriferisphaera corsica]|uniref:Flagellar biosynthesis protein, FliO n=1 Tax=Poriferisphaera corsica TaxID=2528020 RepID=A0A517YSJ4_9BACT|nr:flagellar biosynthetic protein FliO [Poriferisphaera corsica]QDU33181.1 hypothetical protein KS4_12260 [Poriferisphaera corsica]